MPPFRFLFACVLAALSGPGMARAQGLSLGGIATDPSAPVEVTAATLVVDQETGAATFSGGVIVGQGALRLQAAEVEVRYDAASGEIARLIARGGVTFATPSEAAEAREADYDLAGQILTLSGEVLLVQGGNAIAAERMVVDLATGTARLEGGVRTVLGGGTAASAGAAAGGTP
ncbi:Uncharacterized protein putative in bacteria [Rubellimicrobium thermophilum DSM 16684]|uniref:Uncharacterized protein putative in bacteria n=1 Tax=Rubellimicrobium thermophilum DSM 16684 TaxID=1123069 RepID=S9R1Y9_9RHOB|nr:LptA/OstA family protein [Rubellimicrobium thermophilum]EPX87661.1 Uncharacterized protein putative in bacteria [Rubellimicrobium thermophilum DSM 16684]